MKIPCEIIQDLIPLLEDDVCSVQTREAVLEHIKNCETCRRLYEQAKVPLNCQLPIDDVKATNSMKKGFRKIKKIWVISILSILLAIPFLYLFWGELKGQGYSFTNLHEIAIAHRFMEELKEGNYEAAFEHWNIEDIKQEWLENWFEESELENMEKDAKKMFCESASMLKDVGGITDYRFLSVSEQVQSYTCYFIITVHNEERDFDITVSDDGIHTIGAEGSFLTDPVAHLSTWAEFLWQKYEGCIYDPETGEYVY